MTTFVESRIGHLSPPFLSAYFSGAGNGKQFGQIAECTDICMFDRRCWEHSPKLTTFFGNLQTSIMRNLNEECLVLIWNRLWIWILHDGEIAWDWARHKVATSSQVILESAVSISLRWYRWVHLFGHIFTSSYYKIRRQQHPHQLKSVKCYHGGRKIYLIA